MRCWFAAALTIALTVLLAWPSRDLFLLGATDFLSFYAGAKLLGTDELYDPAAASRIQLTDAQAVSDRLPFIRLPFFALLLWPLGQLPYLTAYWIWLLLNFGALVLALNLWPAATEGRRWPACACLSVYWSLAAAQDHAFLLLWITLAIRLAGAGRLRLAGLAFSLCLAKFHLFTLVPLLLIRRRHLDFGVGAVLGCSALLALSFLAAGPGWPLRYAEALAIPSIHDQLAIAPNIHGLTTWWGGGIVTKMALGGAIGLIVCGIAWYGSFEKALGAAIAGSVLISPHIFFADLALLLPLALVVGPNASPAFRRLALAAMLPPLYLSELLIAFPGGLVIPITAMLLLGFLLRQSHRESQPHSRNAAAGEDAAPRLLQSGPVLPH